MITSDTTIQGLVNRVNRYLAQGWKRFGNAHFEDGAYISALAKGDFASDEGGVQVRQVHKVQLALKATRVTREYQDHSLKLKHQQAQALIT